ncbi:patatin-like phospholipase family protein [Prevotella sp. E13-17]|uniref:patatin-like phospholipase family protein n=1 Tax=Prevotella sp. E13-17 TaxID=2913616 RepID=UPI001EDBF707|nr:patatin-like phospholipase family protein [Prevotella sp. E13-17]UKK51023.1 patatin-like phospholipase family protein [Prevotella sp. E13-17]
MKRIIFLLACLLTISSVNAEQQSHRKKVAVVLSGGGAKGVAHIGVLKVLEKAGIPVDIITGTSMGSIVGGLYAIGYNAHSLDSLVRNQDWTYVITDRENLKNQSLSDREKQNTYFISTNTTVVRRNKNAGGLITGKNISELFNKLCVGYTDSLDFSRDLPIPFACVATDIINYEEYDFHSGRLPQAMRASMAIPAVFSPVRLDDKVLVDGGLRNNYPVDIAREMGADIVIGVSVSDHPMGYDDVWGTMSVLNQIINMNCKNKFDENKDNTDLYLYVDPEGYTAASFSPTAIDTLIQRGEDEAMRHWDEIVALKKRIGIDDNFKPTILHPLSPRVMTMKQKIDSCAFVDMTPQDERFLKQKFHLDRLDSIDATLEQQITTSIRVDLFYQTAKCQLEPTKDGQVLRIIAGQRRRSRFHAGARYDNEEYAAVQLGLDVPMKSAIPINTDFTMRLGKRLMARGELTIHPLSFTRPTLRCTFYRNDIDIYADGDRDYNIRYNQFQAELTPINLNLRHFNLQMGVRWDHLHYRNKLGSESSIQLTLKNEHFYSYRALLNYNSEDNWYFPTRGARFKAEYAYLTDNFAKLDGKPGVSDVNANWRISFTMGSRFTLQPMFYGRILLGDNVPLVMGNTIGGEWFGHYVEQQMPFAGIGNMEYVDHQFVAAQLQAQQRIGTNHFVMLRMAGGQQAHHLKSLLENKTLLGTQLAYYYRTLLGPAGATMGYSNQTKQLYFYLNLGFEF